MHGAPSNRACCTICEPRVQIQTRLVDLCRNPKVRGAAAELMLDALQQMRAGLHPDTAESLCQGGILKGLIPLLSDNTPEARASARQAVHILQVRRITVTAVLVPGSDLLRSWHVKYWLSWLLGQSLFATNLCCCASRTHACASCAGGDWP